MTASKPPRRRRSRGARGRRSAAPPSEPPKARPGSRSRRLSRGERVVAVIVTIALTLGSCALALLTWGAFARPGDGRSVRLEWSPEPSSAAAAARLHERGLTRRPLLLTLYLELFADPAEFQAGPHLLHDGLSARDLVRHLRRSALRGTVKVTIPEGFNHLQIAERLEEQGVTPADAFRAAVRDLALLRMLRIPGESAEGYLFPSTYDMPRDSDASNVVRGMVAEFRQRFGRLAEAHAAELQTLKRERGLDAHGVVVLASIVEKEARLAEDRPLIASVYLNRLSDQTFKPQRMLQADPTAGYGCALERDAAPSCAGFDGKITPAMVRDSQNRFNTYKHPGLPPTAIANAGEASLLATLTAPRTDYLFFVHTGGGKHRFSRTLAEHEAATN